eukprot:gb/GECH01009402.1/.p1 GENE.gb/GECH01009402.1/~~gb/GECH01009402.1/.p1  ORF type:complete len:166 (+),score=11.55 gb/GECH01009402.1/:1-498(+)
MNQRERYFESRIPSMRELASMPFDDFSQYALSSTNSADHHYLPRPPHRPIVSSRNHGIDRSGRITTNAMSPMNEDAEIPLDYDTLLRLDDDVEPKGMSDREIKEHTERVSRNQIGKEKKCSICWESLSNRNDLLRLNCHHIFHGACVSKWLKTHITCPICRKPLR